MAQSEGESSENDTTLAQSVSERLRESAFATVAPGEKPTGADVWAAVGGVRGLVESVVPGLTFLLVFSLTGSLAWSVLTPLAIAVVFVLARVVAKSSLQPALVGMAGLAASATVALVSGRPEDNFVLGLWVNAIGLTVMTVSVVVGRPLIGVVTGLLAGDPTWRSDRAKKTLATIATLMWVSLFGSRLAVQVPLFLQGEGAVAELAIARLVMGLPLYALVLWLSWLLMRAVYRAPASQP
jgi:hypothetical protein